jgi:hypothetical protein
VCPVKSQLIRYTVTTLQYPNLRLYVIDNPDFEICILRSMSMVLSDTHPALIPRPRLFERDNQPTVFAIINSAHHELHRRRTVQLHPQYCQHKSQSIGFQIETYDIRLYCEPHGRTEPSFVRTAVLNATSQLAAMDGPKEKLFDESFCRQIKFQAPSGKETNFAEAVEFHRSLKLDGLFRDGRQRISAREWLKRCKAKGWF